VGTDGAFVHVAEKYYLGEPKLWDTMTVRKMKERLAVIKPLVIGKRIPEMVLTDPSGKRLLLSTVPKDYTVVFIYDPECSHCKEETPKLLQQEAFFKEKNVGVFAASIVRDKAMWQKFITEFKIQTWYNGIDIHINPKNGLEEYYTDFKNTFDVYATPVIYILDKSKRIIGKRIPADKIQDFINFYERKK
jgi:thiol-disulfide isomerase/thioredoxin